MTMTRKITSPEDLKALRDKAQKDIALRDGAKDILVTVHMSTCGIAAGARDMLLELAATLSRLGIASVTLRQSGCIGLCDREPMLTLTDKAGQSFVYGALDKNKIHQIVRDHIQGGQPVSQYLVRT